MPLVKVRRSVRPMAYYLTDTPCCCNCCSEDDDDEDEEIPTDCCENPIPVSLFATFSNVQNCTCSTGTIELTYDSGTETWIGSGSICSVGIELTFYCAGGDPLFFA